MKNLRNLEVQELQTIQGGEFFCDEARELGRAIGRWIADRISA